MHQLTLPLFNALPQYCTQVGYSNPTGSQIFFIYQNTSYFRLDVNGTFSLSVLIHLFFYVGFYCIRLTVDLSNPRKVSSITSKNEPETKNLKVTRTCITAETAWFLIVCGVISSATRLTMYCIDSRPKRCVDLNSELV